MLRAFDTDIIRAKGWTPAQTKSNLLAEVEAHRMADRIAPGAYEQKIGGKLKYCAVGCTLHSCFRLCKGDKPNYGVIIYLTHTCEGTDNE